MIAVWLYLAFLVGAIFGKFFKDDETCPRRVLHYGCQGDTCDHRKSVLYENMRNMAAQAEKAELEKERNYWRGGNE